MVKDESDRLKLYDAIVHYGLEGEILDLPYPLNAILSQMISSIGRAQEKYDALVEQGKRGGRPRKWVDRKEAEESFARLGSWKAVADDLNVDAKTLRKARTAWEERDKGKKGKREKPTVSPFIPEGKNGKTYNIIKDISLREREISNLSLSLLERKEIDKDGERESEPPAPNGAARPLPKKEELRWGEDGYRFEKGGVIYEMRNRKVYEVGRKPDKAE